MEQETWYIAFAAKYISGEAKSDGDENSEVIWMPVEEALRHEDVPGLMKSLIEAALAEGNGLGAAIYESNKHTPCSLYCVTEK